MVIRNVGTLRSPEFWMDAEPPRTWCYGLILDLGTSLGHKLRPNGSSSADTASWDYFLLSCLSSHLGHLSVGQPLVLVASRFTQHNQDWPDLVTRSWAPSQEGQCWLEFAFQQSCSGCRVGAQYIMHCWPWLDFDTVNFDIGFRHSLADQGPWVLQSTDSYSFPFLSHHTITQPLGTLAGTICAYYWISTSVPLLSTLHLNFSSNKHCKKTLAL